MKMDIQIFFGIAIYIYMYKVFLDSDSEFLFISSITF